MYTIKPDQIIDLEQPLIKVPYEQLRKSFRHSFKYVEKELASLNDKVERRLTSEPSNSSVWNSADFPAQAQSQDAAEAATQTIDEMLAQVERLSHKLQTSQANDVRHAKRIKTRIDHLSEIESVTSPKDIEFRRWSRTRLDRVIVDYLLRDGLPETAKRMAQESGIEDMVDIQLFAQSAKVENALRNRSCKECLQWCAENRSGLKKLKSSLEFNLRLQEHIELARAEKRMEALVYSKKYLTPWKDVEQESIMQAMGLLAFKSDTLCQPFKDLFDSNRWQILITKFRADNYALCALTSHPLLSITLQAGLSSLKSTQCYKKDHKNVNCPVCDETALGKLAEKLPLRHQVNSNIVCHISGKIMNEDNPPMILPNGRVYSLEALHDMATKNGGLLICPRTGDTFKLEDIKKVFVS